MCEILQPSTNPPTVQADNDSIMLLIIDVRLLIKYNALTNHVIVIISMIKYSLTKYIANLFI